MPSRLGHGLYNYKKKDRLKNIFRCIIIRPQQFNILFLIQCNIKNQCGRAALFTNTAGKTQHVIHRDTELTLFNSALQLE